MADSNSESCADDFEKGALSVQQANDKIIAEITPIKGIEKLSLRSCLGLYLAEDILSPINVPAHINSAMDGYALAGSDLPTEGEKNFPVAGITFAGKPTTENIQKGQVIRIMTGGVMPEGTDTVVMQEQVKHVDENTISLGAIHTTGQNVRQAGEDIATGEIVLSNGRQITAADLGVLASLGIAEVRVYRRPRVAFFSTGDELRSIGETLGEGEVYDSNRYTLYSMLKQLNVEILDMGVIPDTKEDIKNAFISASEMADVVITSGGVSVGDADYIKPTLQALGQTHFQKVRIKPGRPLTFGTLNNAKFFGLPGNPVAVMVTFMQFVQPAINYLASGKAKKPMILSATSQSKFYKRAGRSEYQRGIFEQADDGSLTVKRTGKQGSGILTSMSLANCFIAMNEKSTGAEIGDKVDIQIFKML